MSGLDLDSLTLSVSGLCSFFRAFQCLEPVQAQSDHITTKIPEQEHAFQAVLKHSLDVAVDGIRSCQGAIMLCDRMMEEEVAVLVQEMAGISREASKRASAVQHGILDFTALIGPITRGVVLESTGTRHSEAIEMYFNAKDGDDAISDNLSRLIHWWRVIEDELRILQGVILILRRDRPGRLDVARRRWERVKELYTLYYKGIHVLEGSEGKQNELLIANSVKDSKTSHVSDSIQINIDPSSSRRALTEISSLYPGVPQLHSSIGDNFLDAFSDGLLSSFRQVNDLNGGLSLSRAALELLPSSHPLRPHFLHKLSNLLTMQFKQREETLYLDEAIEHGREALRLLPVFHPSRFACLSSLMEAVSTRFHRTRTTADLDEAISLHRAALGSIPNTSGHPGLLNNLGCLFYDKFEREGEMVDLEEAILLHREAFHSSPSRSHPYHLEFLHNLGNVLWRRSDEMEDIACVQEAILLFRSGLELIGISHPYKYRLLKGLALALKSRFDRTLQITDLEEAILLYREALELLPHHLQFDPLNNLANALHTRFHHTHQASDIEEAVLAHRMAIESLPNPHPQKWLFLNNTASTLCTQSSQTDHIDTLHEAISLFREALQLLPEQHHHLSVYVNNLADALRSRASQTGEISDLNEAMSLHRATLELLPAIHPRRPEFQKNLANVFSARFELTGQISDIDEAISLCREVQDLLPAIHQPGVLNDLGLYVWRRFEHTGRMSDLDESISLHRAALELRSTFSVQPVYFRDGLANALMSRFYHARQMLDIDEAISLLRATLKLEYPNPSRRVLNNLANAINGRFGVTRKHSDINEVVILRRQALVQSPASHPDHLAYLSNAAGSLSIRFTLMHQVSDLNESVSYLREARDLHLKHPHHVQVLSNLSMNLQELFKQTHRAEYLTEAISLSRDALHSIPRGHPDTCSGFRCMYDHDHKREYLDQAMDAFRAGVISEFSPTSARFIAARQWAIRADGIHDSALEAYGIAIRLLPRLAMLGLDLESRHKALAQEISTRGLPSDAAACAISTNQIDKAVELLEEGRSIFWSQALHLRTPLDELKAQHNDLGNKLENLSRALESGSFRETLRTLEDASQKVVSMEQEAVHFRRLNEEWTSTLEEIRRLDGFHDFLLPKKLPELQRAALNGPVVILNTSRSRCDALILTQSAVQHVPLSALTIEMVVRLVKQMRSLPNFSYRDANERYLKKRNRNKTSNEQFRDILATLWTTVAEPVIRSLELKKSKTPPRLWWCPTGLLAFLPIHAAGIYNAEDMKDGECVFNYVTSSYTPTISALLSSPTSFDGAFKMMVIIQPNTPGQVPLPYTKDELLMIERHVSSTSLVKLGGPDSAPATVETVLARLPSASIVHFACHGIQNAVNPLDSAIVLENGQLTVARIMQQPLPKADLAFLSACQTAMGDEDSPDEAMHIAATLLFAGFRGAVATMWSIADEDGPKVSDYFYGELLKKNSQGNTSNSLPYPDTSHAARALHVAVSRMRDGGIPFERWVPFIHMGL